MSHPPGNIQYPQSTAKSGNRPTDMAIPDSAQRLAIRTPVASPMAIQDKVMELLPSAGTVELTDSQKEILYSPIDIDDIEIREDGIVYLPWMEYATRLREAFGMEWAVIPEGEPKLDKNLILIKAWLIVQGKPAACVWGEQEYRPSNMRMSYGDAIAGAQSNALMRLCKAIGIGLELWKPSFIKEWKANNAESKWVKKKGQNKQIWVKKAQESQSEGRHLGTTRSGTGLKTEYHTDPKHVESEPSDDVEGKTTPAGTEIPQDSQEQPDSSQPPQNGKLKSGLEKLKGQAFLLVDELGINQEDHKRMCYYTFKLKSRENMDDRQWSDHIADLRVKRDIDAALTHISARGIPDHGLQLYFKCRYGLPWISTSQHIRTQIATIDDNTFARFRQAVEKFAGWVEKRAGGHENVHAALIALTDYLIAIQDEQEPVVKSVRSKFFDNLGIAVDGSVHNFAGSANFEDWKEALRGAALAHGLPEPVFPENEDFVGDLPDDLRGNIPDKDDPQPSVDGQDIEMDGSDDAAINSNDAEDDISF